MKLAKVEAPICLSCKYGKATRKPWRSKLSPNTVPSRAVTAPGDCVNVDHMVSSTPGFVAQMKGTFTKARYTGATIIVDHYSWLCYVYPQKSMSAAETIEAKGHFERFAASYGVSIKH
jgi:hypothetical protein